MYVGCSSPTTFGAFDNRIALVRIFRCFDHVDAIVVVVGETHDIQIVLDSSGNAG